MIKSMTGYGRCEQIIESMNICAEIKSVNHRFFEFSLRIPRSYSFLEEKIKKLIQSRVSRGKIDCFVSIEVLESEQCDVSINEPLAEGYIRAISEIAQKYSLPNDLTAFDVARYPDVISIRRPTLDEEKTFDAVKPVIEGALDKYIEMKAVEGKRLSADCVSRIETIEQKLAQIEDYYPQTITDYEERLRHKIEELLETKPDEQRLLTEVAIFADRVAIDEETVRLSSHLKQMKAMLLQDEAVGRKLDFLMQEINRETNTICSKCQNLDISRTVVDIKAEAEKIREQIQNIE